MDDNDSVCCTEDPLELEGSELRHVGPVPARSPDVEARILHDDEGHLGPVDAA